VYQREHGAPPEVASSSSANGAPASGAWSGCMTMSLIEKVVFKKPRKA